MLSGMAVVNCLGRSFYLGQTNINGACQTSGSGLDPHISTENAGLQADRVAKARSLKPEQVRDLIQQNTAPADLGALVEAALKEAKDALFHDGHPKATMGDAMVELAMRQSNGTQTHAAKLLDISRDALRYKLKKFGLIRGDDEGSQTGAVEEQ